MKLELRHISKTFGSVKALDDFSVTFTEGIYGILGPNGAGKSTMINLITDNVKRDKNGGEILFDGEEILKLGKSFRRLVGYMPQQQGFYDNFSAKAFLSYMAQVKEIPAKQAKEQIDSLLRTVNLEKAAHQKIGGFSGGMKQRVLLAQALLGDPKILILDEPTAGLDPKERINIRNFISELSKNKIILLATHVVSDIECIAGQVMLIKGGHLIGIGAPFELIESIEGKVAELPYDETMIHTLEEAYFIGNVSQKKSGMMLRLVSKEEKFTEFPEQARPITEDINLEDVYLYYLGA